MVWRGVRREEKGGDEVVGRGLRLLEEGGDGKGGRPGAGSCLPVAALWG